MAEYLVNYYNGRGNRDSVFSTEAEAREFMATCVDPMCTLWKRVRDEVL
jgi:hypothetical protein